MMRKLTATGAVAIAVLAACAVASAAKLPTFKSDLIVPNRSVAGVTLKSTYKQAVRAFRTGAGGCSTTRGCAYRASDGATFSILFARLTQTSKPIVAQISVQAGNKIRGSKETPLFDTPLATLKTAKGIGLGSTFAAVRRAYPHAAGNARLGLVIRGHGEYGTQFSFLDGRLTLIQMQAVHLG